MNRRTTCRILAAAPLALAMAAAAQSGPVLRIAWVSPERPDPQSPNLVAFRKGLASLGYEEGRNLVVDAWWGDGSTDRLEQMAGDIVRARPDVVVTGSGLAVLPMMRAGIKLPIVFVLSVDPVEAKVVASFARPGANVTGVTLFSLNLMGKRLELLKEMVPGVKRIAIIANPEHSGEPLELKAARDAATRLGLSHRYFPMSSESELEQALGAIAKGRDDAIIAFADGFTMSFADVIAAFSIKHRIPAVSGWALFAQRGNLMAYGPVIDECYQRLAVFVDRIYKGTKPADLPVELPTKFELAVNLRTAQALGIAVPQSLLLRADVVIR